MEQPNFKELSEQNKELPEFNVNDFMDGQILRCTICGGNTFSMVLTDSTMAFNCPKDAWRGIIFSLPSMMPKDLAPRKIMEDEYKTPVSLQLVTTNKQELTTPEEQKEFFDESVALVKEMSEDELFEMSVSRDYIHDSVITVQFGFRKKE